MFIYGKVSHFLSNITLNNVFCCVSVFNAFFILNFLFICLYQEDSADSAGSTSDNENDDYYEDFHLPMSHLTSMSTRRSFKRKLRALDVCVADLPNNVNNEPQNNSSRRKIVPQPRDFHDESFISEHSETSPVKLTSTPNQTITDIEMGCESTIHQPGVHVEEMQLDERTMLKVRECLDSERIKDIYTLGSRLQDLLTPAELMEVMSKRQDNIKSTSSNPEETISSGLNHIVDS